MNLPAKSKTVDASVKKSREPRKNATIKRHRGLHPPEVALLLPKIPLAIPEANDEFTYSDLTNSSSYAEYAWAFLRRNRFYQQLCDKTSSFSLSAWGFEARPGEWSYGLTSIKQYEQPYGAEEANSAPQWIGIDSFARQLQALPVSGPVGRNRDIAIEYPEDQVGVVFDLALLLGGQSSAIDIPLQLAREKLLAMIAARAQAKHLPETVISERINRSRPPGHRPSKMLLRAQLRLADLLSGPIALAAAQESDPKSLAAKAAAKALKELSGPYTRAGSTSLKISHIIDLVPTYDLKRGVAKSQPSRAQRISRASELTSLAYLNIYQWHMMSLLQYDPWQLIRK
jgi:hypothetical protein